MKTIIIYTSKYGYARDCALQLAALLEGEVQTVDAAGEKVPDAAAFDRIILGGPVYMGQIPKSLKQWMAGNLETLCARPTGLFLCCGLPDQFQETLANAFPPELLRSAADIRCFGGELRLGNMKRMDRLLAGAMEKAGAGQGKEPVRPMPENIIKMAEAMNKV